MEQASPAGRDTDTIIALSSGHPPAGVAVIRLSGPLARTILAELSGSLPPPRQVAYRAVRDPASGETIDRGVIFHLPGPGTFTGEDVAELQLHGGRAVVTRVLRLAAGRPGCRLAEAGEFTRRAFLNGRIDLTAAEGLADLIAAETEAQRLQALGQADGRLDRAAARWREDILEVRALLEAHIDFSDEEDAGTADLDDAAANLDRVAGEMSTVLADSWRGERIRSGYRVVLLGPPNAGKSSLLNALSQREVAIVTDIPGTTRDILEVHLDLDGVPVTLIDTAGLRAAADVVEAEGVRRAIERARSADLVLWLDPGGIAVPPEIASSGRPVLRLAAKADLRSGLPDGDIPVSVVRAGGLEPLLSALRETVGTGSGREPPLVTQERQRICVADALESVTEAQRSTLPLEIRAESLRRASDSLGRLVGRTDVEEVLGAIFSRFCIGK